MSTENKATGKDYDDLEGNDDASRRRWSVAFCITLLCGLGYWGYYHFTQKDFSSIEVAEMDKEHQAKLAEETEDRPVLSNEMLLDLSQNQAAMKDARKIFQENCSGCHGLNGQGIIGPNLADEEWIYGGSGMDVFRSIMEGRNNQMPAWGPVLGEKKVSQLTAYVLNLKK